jgi:hypothetical protein
MFQKCTRAHGNVGDSCAATSAAANDTMPLAQCSRQPPIHFQASWLSKMRNHWHSSASQRRLYACSRRTRMRIAYTSWLITSSMQWQ